MLATEPQGPTRGLRWPPATAYDGDNLIEETNSSGTVVARYSQTPDTMDQPLAMVRGGATSFYNLDGLGSTTSLSSSAGSFAQTYTFDSFGKTTNSSGSLVNPFQYTSRELDTETNLYNFRARYYDQNSGRFLSEDLIAFSSDSYNFYDYVGNDPVDFSDPSGNKKNSRKLVWPQLDRRTKRNLHPVRRRSWVLQASHRLRRQGLQPS